MSMFLGHTPSRVARSRGSGISVILELNCGSLLRAAWGLKAPIGATAVGALRVGFDQAQAQPRIDQRLAHISTQWKNSGALGKLRSESSGWTPALDAPRGDAARGCLVRRPHAPHSLRDPSFYAGVGVDRFFRR